MESCNDQLVVDNLGLIRRSSGSGTVVLGAVNCVFAVTMVNNSGVIDVQSGRLTVMAFNTNAQDSGSFVVGSPAALEFAGNGGRAISGTLNVSGLLAVSGSVVTARRTSSRSSFAGAVRCCASAAPRPRRSSTAWVKSVAG